MPDSNSDSRKTLSPSKVAGIFGVTVPTVRAWDKAEKLPPSFRTPGGQRRWYADEIEAARGAA